jgi:AP2 domain
VVIGVPLYGVKARGRVAWVSEHRYDLVMAYRWHVEEDRRPTGRIHGPYAVTKVRYADGRRGSIRMHDLIMGCKGVDHRNGYGLDNTDPNLRKATDAQNGHNRGKQAGVTSSDFKGVYWRRDRQKWLAYIYVGGKRRDLGLFAAEEDAARAHDAVALETRGDFARLNFPRELPP